LQPSFRVKFLNWLYNFSVASNCFERIDINDDGTIDDKEFLTEGVDEMFRAGWPQSMAQKKAMIDDFFSVPQDNLEGGGAEEGAGQEAEFGQEIRNTEIHVESGGEGDASGRNSLARRFSIGGNPETGRRSLVRRVSSTVTKLRAASLLLENLSPADTAVAKEAKSSTTGGSTHTEAMVADIQRQLDAVKLDKETFMCKLFTELVSDDDKSFQRTKVLWYERIQASINSKADHKLCKQMWKVHKAAIDSSLRARTHHDEHQLEMISCSEVVTWVRACTGFGGAKQLPEHADEHAEHGVRFNRITNTVRTSAKRAATKHFDTFRRLKSNFLRLRRYAILAFVVVSLILGPAYSVFLAPVEEGQRAQRLSCGINSSVDSVGFVGPAGFLHASSNISSSSSNSSSNRQYISQHQDFPLFYEVRWLLIVHKLVVYTRYSLLCVPSATFWFFHSSLVQAICYTT
jgi:hypothetical protein